MVVLFGGVKLISEWDSYLDKKRGTKFDFKNFDLSPNHKETVIALLAFPLLFIIITIATAYFLSKIL